MFFDGAHDSKKKVSLGGKSRGKAQESKQDFIERTKKEREDRENARRREKAAINIQGFVRSRKVLSQLREGERAGWDVHFESLVQEWATQLPDQKAAITNASVKLAGLLRRLLFFYREWLVDDGKRLSRLAVWLVSGRLPTLSVSGPPGISILIASSADDYIGRRRAFAICHLSLKRLATGCGLRTVKRATGQGFIIVDNANSKTSDSYLSRLEIYSLDAGLLLRFCDAACWGGAENQTRRLQLIDQLVESGLMKMVRGHLDLSDNIRSEAPAAKQLQQQLQLLLCGLVVHALNSGSLAARESFYLHLLTRPLFLQSLSKQSRQLLEFKGLWDLTIETLSKSDCSLLRRICDADGGDAAAGTLGNLIDMSAASLGTASPAATGRFAACAGLLLERARRVQEQRRAAAEADGAVDDAMDVDDDSGSSHVQRVEIEVETVAGRVKMQHVKVQRTEAEGGMAARKRGLPPGLASVREQLSAICNKEYVFKLLDVVQRLPPPSTTAAAGEAVASSQDRTIIAATAGLLLQLTEFLPETRTDMLNALAFKPAVLTMLWDWVRTAGPVTTATGSRTDPFAAASAAGSAAEPSLLTLFCMIYNYLLVTVDNSEFYDRQYPFTLEQVREMVHAVKAAVVPLYFTAARLAEPQTALRSAGTVLLTSLLERNCYREFVPTDEWLAPDRHVNAVVAELDGAAAMRLADPDRPDAAAPLDWRFQLVLERVPFVLPFALRVRILRHLVSADRRTLADTPHHWIRATVRRARVVEDSYRELNRYGPELKQTIQISFINQEGLPEAGIDGGGLFKEFVNTLSRQAFNPHYGLFCTTPDGLLFPNPQAESTHPWQGLDHLALFEFLGRVVGKAIYDGILIELRLAPFFLRRMLGQALHFDDLRGLDPELHRNLSFVRTYEGDFEDLALNFVVVEDHFGEARTRELVPGGAGLPVTRENVHRYRHLVSDYWLNRRIRPQSEAFMRGLKDLIRPEWIRAFTPSELQVLVAGAGRPIDLADLRANCQYTGGYADDHPCIQLFWAVAEELSHAEREALLMFVTSCSRPPLLGFRELHPSFCIQKTSHTPEEADSRLPTASTCMNLLKLPCYSNAADLKARLLYAISAGAGFELS